MHLQAASHSQTPAPVSEEPPEERAKRKQLEKQAKEEQKKVQLQPSKHCTALQNEQYSHGCELTCTEWANLKAARACMIVSSLCFEYSWKQRRRKLYEEQPRKSARMSSVRGLSLQNQVASLGRLEDHLQTGSNRVEQSSLHLPAVAPLQ